MQQVDAAAACLSFFLSLRDQAKQMFSLFFQRTAAEAVSQGG
jgi:hypothetical protein